MRDLHKHEIAVFTMLAHGASPGDIRENLGPKIGGRGRVDYCLAELAGLGLWNRHNQTLTPRGAALAPDAAAAFPRPAQAPTTTTTTVEP